MLLLLLQQLGFADERKPNSLKLDDISVDYRDGRYFATLSLYVAVPPSLAQQVLTDFDHMAEFIPNLSSSRIVSHTGNIFVIEQQGRAGFGPFSIRFASERRVELRPGGWLISQAISGTAKATHSELHIQEEKRGTRIDYHLEMQPDQWMPSSLGVNFMRHELYEQFGALAGEMERRHKSPAGR